MASVIPLYVFVAIIFSTMLVVAITSTGLHRTPLCVLPSFGITSMVWMAYPPAQQLSPMVAFFFWVVISILIYYFPVPTNGLGPSHTPSHHDDDLLDRFFKETSSYDH